jgi:hypothetical protein
MQAVIEAGVTNSEELVKINRYRCHQQVLFVSDILDAVGKCLNKKYPKQRQDNESWSSLIFPIKKPRRRHGTLWEQVLFTLAPQSRASQRVGRFLTKGHKIWDWCYDEGAKCVYHIKGQTMDIYTPSAIPQYANCPNCWTRSRLDVPHEELGKICSVQNVTLAVYSVVSSCAGPPTPAPPTDFWSMVESWGNTWMWDNLTIRGDISWLAESIADNSLVAVTDGSYMKDVYPHLTLAAFVFKCTKGRERLWGSFVERTPDAGSYQGKLLGLMAINLILRAVNKVSTDLTGSVLVFLIA